MYSVGDWNLQDWKMTDHQTTEGVEFAELENDGVKMTDWKMTE